MFYYDFSRYVKALFFIENLFICLCNGKVCLSLFIHCGFLIQVDLPLPVWWYDLDKARSFGNFFMLRL